MMGGHTIKNQMKKYVFLEEKRNKRVKDNKILQNIFVPNI